MIPLRDSQPSGTVPVVNILIIILNSLVWFYEVSRGTQFDYFILQHGLIPTHLTHFYRLPGGFWDNALEPLFSSIFMHAGWLHIIGNMWFLWVFGDNVEHRLGHFRYLVFYLLCGVGASLIHVFSSPWSRIPTVGASGAISGVLGAYLVSYPHARITTLLIIVVFIRVVELPAFLFLIFWFAFQFLSGAAEITAHPDTGGVAYWAHIGGFVVGIVALWIMPKKPVPQYRRLFESSDY
jgi:membrane associated rhomboid family serine protease